MKYLVFTQINMVLSAVALLLALDIYFKWDLSAIHYLVFALTIWWVYIFDIMSSYKDEDKISHPVRCQFVSENKIMFTAVELLIPLLLAFISFAHPEFLSFLFIIFFSFALSAAYSRGIRSLRLKSSGLNKTLIIALAWAGGVFFYGLYFTSDEAGVQVQHIPVFVIIFVLLYLDTYLLDYQDRESDKAYGVVTAANNPAMNRFFAGVNGKLSALGEVELSLLVSSWRYLLLLMALGYSYIAL